MNPNRWTVFLFFFHLGLTAFCQDTAPIRLFINCSGEDCHEEYLISELSFFNFVRDRAQADVELFIVQQTTASEGTRYTIDFNGFNSFKDFKLSQSVSFKMTDTDVTVREELLRIVKLNLSGFVLKSPWKNSLTVNFPKRDQMATIDTNSEDRWNNWVFLLGTEGNFEGESNRTELQSESYVGAYRKTLHSKIVLDARYESTFNRYFVDNKNLRASVHSYGMGGYYVKSISEHLSAGGFASVEHDNFRNIEWEGRFLPAVEYNFYRFSENTTRQLRLGYQVGLRHFTYKDTTIFNKLTETRPFQRIALVANYAKPWGRLSGVVQYSTYLDNLRQNRLTGRINTSIRIAEGLNFMVEGSSSLVNDQISLLKKTLPEEVYLLNGAQLPTRFLFEFRIGVSFTFGSTNNSIVNPRFENLDD